MILSPGRLPRSRQTSQSSTDRRIECPSAGSWPGRWARPSRDSTSWVTDSSARPFQLRRISTGYLAWSLSTSFEHVWQSQIPLSIELRSSEARLWLYRGPPGDAAVMWAATPTTTAFDGSV